MTYAGHQKTITADNRAIELDDVVMEALMGVST